MRSSRPPRLDWESASLEGGWFAMGADDGPHREDGEGPVRQVYVDPFCIGTKAVSNREYAQFVAETGYQTVAEQQGWSFVFHLLVPEHGEPVAAALPTPWWRKVPHANWASPGGPGTEAQAGADLPAVHIALQDALAFCAWAHCRLPTEAEWEFAARGGLSGNRYPWGNTEAPNGTPMTNVWRGRFPDRPEAGPAFRGPCEVGAFPPNGYGLYNMVGNVWEWTSDRFTHLHGPQSVRNPIGPLNGARFVAKGGSYLCHPSYCDRYRTSSRQGLAPDTTAGHIGFRVGGRTED